MPAIELTKSQYGKEKFASQMTFDFSEVHPAAKFHINFQRTLRIPDDGKLYPLPPGLGSFPMVHTEDYKDRVPAKWLERQGVILPMYQSEALWLNFHSMPDPESGHCYPFALKVAAGKRSAVTGKAWVQSLKPKDYLVLPDQSWLDGFVVDEGTIRQFVAVPLGMGLTVEAQLSGEEAFGGIQLEAYPMKREEYERRFPPRNNVLRAQGFKRLQYMEDSAEYSSGPIACAASADMGLGAGGKMHQEVYEDRYGLDVWDLNIKKRVFIHLANSLGWRAITKQEPPNAPFGPSEYQQHGFPWFDLYQDGFKALKATKGMKGLKSILELGFQKGLQGVIQDNASIEVPDTKVVTIKKPGVVQDGQW